MQYSLRIDHTYVALPTTIRHFSNYLINNSRLPAKHRHHLTGGAVDLSTYHTYIDDVFRASRSGPHSAAQFHVCVYFLSKKKRGATYIYLLIVGLQKVSHATQFPRWLYLKTTGQIHMICLRTDLEKKKKTHSALRTAIHKFHASEFLPENVSQVGTYLPGR